jgi:lipopolysaccharide transport system ATP-binding protein
VIALEVRNLAKNYPLGGSQWSRLRHVLAGNRINEGDGIWAVRDVSFSVARGEAFGIVGANGSGKSTLLQMIAGILRPTSGSVEVHGRLSALLELGSGFSPEFTGRSNVYLNGSILGLSKEEIDARFPDIERFAEIGEFIDQPVRTYSTGMVLRLAFSVVAHVDPEILIVDEALAVGDIAFHQRCMRRIHDLRARGTTILFVSHSITDVKALCERCLWLQNGKVMQVGAADDVAGKYLSATTRKEPDRGREPVALQAPPPAADLFADFEGKHRYGDGRAAIVGAGLETSDIRAILRLTFKINAAIPSPVVGFLVRNSKGEVIFGSSTARENHPVPPLVPSETQAIEFRWAMPPLSPGAYTISVAIADGDMEQFEVCDYVEDAVSMHIAGTGAPSGRGYLRLSCASVAIRHS